MRKYLIIRKHWELKTECQKGAELAGDYVGPLLGKDEGEVVGRTVGELLGCPLGRVDGWLVGSTDGCEDGFANK
jgi:hypothetical protein